MLRLGCRQCLKECCRCLLRIGWKFPKPKSSHHRSSRSWMLRFWWFPYSEVKILLGEAVAQLLSSRLPSDWQYPACVSYLNQSALHLSVFYRSEWSTVAFHTSHSTAPFHPCPTLGIRSDFLPLLLSLRRIWYRGSIYGQYLYKIFITHIVRKNAVGEGISMQLNMKGEFFRVRNPDIGNRISNKNRVWILALTKRFISFSFATIISCTLLPLFLNSLNDLIFEHHLAEHHRVLIQILP